MNSIEWEIEEAIIKISTISLNGSNRMCSQCGQMQGYLFEANEVRKVLKELLEFSQFEKKDERP